jgi:hypothetical protein
MGNTDFDIPVITADKINHWGSPFPVIGGTSLSNSFWNFSLASVEGKRILM